MEITRDRFILVREHESSTFSRRPVPEGAFREIDRTDTRAFVHQEFVRVRSPIKTRAPSTCAEKKDRRPCTPSADWSTGRTVTGFPITRPENGDGGERYVPSSVTIFYRTIAVVNFAYKSR